MSTCTVGPSAVTGERCGRPAVTSFTSRSGRVYFECADHAPAEGQTVPSPAVAQIKHGPRAKLTEHQKEVFSRLHHRSGSLFGQDNKWVPLSTLGSKQGLLHLVRKGWAEVKEERGPRGGILLFFRSTV
jgi:hypothetical protein